MKVQSLTHCKKYIKTVVQGKLMSHYYLYLGGGRAPEREKKYWTQNFTFYMTKVAN